MRRSSTDIHAERRGARLARMSYEPQLYEIFYPNQALVASHLQPQQFAQHYLISSIRHYTGKLVFAQVSPRYRHPDLPIEQMLRELTPHPDGSPKRTKFIASYRVLEHTDLDSIDRLFLATAQAQLLELRPSEYSKSHQSGFLRTFAQIAPLSMLVLSTMDMPEFGRYMTKPGNAKGCPSLFYTQIDLNTEEFLDQFAANPFMSAPFPFLHPAKLRDALAQLRAEPAKQTKGLSLYCPLDQIPFRRIRHGFMFARGELYKFFPMPGLQAIEEANPRFDLS
jgi:hypothetical protein